MIEKLIAGVGLIGAIGAISGAGFFFDDRYAKADDLDMTKKQSAMTHNEMRLDNYEYNLMGLQLRAKYTEGQTVEQVNYVTYEIVRVENQIKKIKRRIEND